MRRRPFGSRDAAVSPVVGTILMVAVTVILAAGVYAWVSAYTQHASGGVRLVALHADPTHGSGILDATIVSVTPGLRLSDVDATLDGVPLSLSGDCAAKRCGARRGRRATRRRFSRSDAAHRRHARGRAGRADPR